jgi:ribonucleoside-diphosphate reductase alpha chain
MARRELAHRRLCITETLCWRNNFYDVSVGFFDDGTPAEIFVRGCKAGSEYEALARDWSVSVSIALQHGTPLETIAHAMLREPNGAPASLFGAIVQYLGQFQS